ncbi:hypothetical protein [Ideonella oryzae]|uniref:DUF4214 domain-containing protein n=1 Tax=Ideonella oryzae TaxID=2937441 RepID=A0ABT1BRZ6_9BURK|nr:hypothetical protein [Ideonella oryzae]MCO5978960.1 hypothetical protein [Ideonella oryzae]
MTDAHLPTAPQTVRASELLEGDDEGFVINAYLALQRQWPDVGGFAHYHWQLSQRPQARLELLREIARSASAQRSGVVFEDDFPAEQTEAPRLSDPVQSRLRYLTACERLRVPQLARQSLELQALLSGVSLEGIGEAVRTVIETSMAQLAQLESRLNSLQVELADLRARLTLPDMVQAPPPAEGSPAWMQRELLRLGQRVQALEQGRVGDLPGRTPEELKRELADYVSAMVTVQADLAAQQQVSLALAAVRGDVPPRAEAP